MISRMKPFSNEKCKIHSFLFKVLFFPLEIKIHNFRKKPPNLVLPVIKKVAKRECQQTGFGSNGPWPLKAGLCPYTPE
jgi:hypothetical protein